MQLRVLLSRPSRFRKRRGSVSFSYIENISCIIDRLTEKQPNLLAISYLMKQYNILLAVIIPYTYSSHLTNRLNELSVVCLPLTLPSSLQPLSIRSNIFAIDLTNSIYPSRIWCYITLIKCKYYTCIILPSLQRPLQKRASAKLQEMYNISTFLKID